MLRQEPPPPPTPPIPCCTLCRTCLPLPSVIQLYVVSVSSPSCFFSQAHAGARRVKMLTFDADDTLFPGGCSLSQDDWVVEAILTFLRKGNFCHGNIFSCQHIISIYIMQRDCGALLNFFDQMQALRHSTFSQQPAGLVVAVVTAAGYPGADGARKFESASTTILLLIITLLLGTKPGFVACLMP